jgi:uncharacterized protein involved in cysteine biosynthesis
MTALSLLFLLITLPLNALPLLGSALFICINGMTFGWGLHSSYFSMKGLGFSQQLQFVRKHWKDYMAFGASALILSMIPLLNLLTVWTNIVGSGMSSLLYSPPYSLLSSHSSPSLLLRCLHPLLLSLLFSTLLPQHFG